MKTLLSTGFLAVFLSVSVSLHAVNEMWLARRNAPPIGNPAAANLVKDGQFDFMLNNASWPTQFSNQQATARIMLGTDPALLLNPLNPYSITVTLQVNLYNLQNVIASTKTEVFTISYDGSAGAKENALQATQYLGYHKFSVHIVSMVNNLTGAAMTSSPSNLYLYSELMVERYYPLDLVSTPFTSANSLYHDFIDTDNDGVFDDVEFSYKSIPGAETYDLEWSWIDNYGATPNTFKTAAQVAFTLRDFELNCSRATLSGSSYRMPLLFNRGFLIYRMRARGKGGPNFKEDIFSPWSTASMVPTATTVSAFPHFFETVKQNTSGALAEHDRKKNWQHQVTFAEDGKRKDVITYFDGSLRNQQVLTRLNSQKIALAADTYYDHVGRPAVQTLPVPTGAPALRYQAGFNRNTALAFYSKKDFDLSASACGLTAAPMSTTSGASKYYSSNNPVLNNWQDFVPDAQGFPFTQTQYTPDLTGRITAQGGVGAVHRLGSTHETRNFFGQPFQVELDRLFGYEVGYKTRYQKNVVVDPNGQVSVTYLDAAGRTIATALAGAKPANLEPVSDEFGKPLTPAQTVLRVDLLNKDFPADPDDLQDDNQLFSTGLLGAANDGLRLTSSMVAVASNSLYRFDAKVTRGAFNLACMGSNCFPFVYDYHLSLQDECGLELFAYNNQPAKPLSATLGAVDLSGTNCSIVSESWNASNGLQAILPIGNYTISKKLTVNGSALDKYAARYIELGQANGCIKTLQDFVVEQESLLHPEDCNTSCEKCVEDLGPDDGSQLWKDNYKLCMEPCEQTSPCEVAYETMLVDVSPGGQYGHVGNDPIEMAFSVFNNGGTTFLPLGTNFWQNPKTEQGAPSSYLNDRGEQLFVKVIQDPNNLNAYFPPLKSGATPTQVNGALFVNPKDLANLADFLPLWRAEWAEQLVYYHPERGYLDWCRGLGTKPGTMNYSSESFDMAMLSADNYARSQNFTLAGVNLILDNPKIGANWIDPFFQVGIPGKLFGADLTAAQNEFAVEILGSFQNSGRSLKQYVMYVLECGTWYGSGNCATSTYPGNDPDKAWELYKMLYQSTKQRIEYKYRDKYALANQWYNDCMDNDNFNWYLNGFGYWGLGNTWQGSFYQFPNQPCGRNRFFLYQTKKPRFIKKVGPYDVTQDLGSLFTQTTDELPAEFYQATGRCPLEVGLEALLNRMTRDGKLLATNQPLFGIAEFTPGLYQAVSGINPQKPPLQPFRPYVWSAATAGPNLTIQFTGSQASCSQLTLQLPTSFSANWSTYGTQWKILSWQQLVPTGGTYNFAVLVHIDNDLTNPNNPIIEKVLTGTTCIPLGGCGTQPLACKGSKMAEEFLQLFNSLLADGKLNSTITTAVPLQGLAYDVVFDANSHIRARLAIAFPATLSWQKNSSLQFLLGNLQTGAPSSQKMLILLSSALPTNIIQFTKTEFTNAGKLKVYFTVPGTSGGAPSLLSRELTILVSDRPVTPRECCFDARLATEVAAMLSAHLNGSLSGSNNTLQSPTGQMSNFYTTGIASLVNSQGTSLGEPVIIQGNPQNNAYNFNISLGKTGKVLCSIKLEPANTGAPVNWPALLTAVSNIEASSGPAQYPFTCTGQLSNGQSIALQGLSCFNFSDCKPCPPPTPPVPISCNDAYVAYINQLNNLFGSAGIPLDLQISEQRFCQNQVQYCAQAHVNYLTQLLPNATAQTSILPLLTFCTDATPDQACPRWHPPVQWPALPAPDNPCLWFMQHLIQQNALTNYEHYINDLIKDFKRLYIEAALATVVEELNLDAPDQEYHYTLYYYDRAGNLVRTVPPRGVHRYDLAAAFSISGSPATTVGAGIKYARQQRKQSLAPPNRHNYLTTYAYNSLNQLIRQDNPDGGITQFWYDGKGRLLASQNARQKPFNQYSYTRYDELGRIVEVGQLASAAPPSETLLNDPTYPDNWAIATNRTEVTKTWYDTPGSTFVFQSSNPIPEGQHNLRNRVVRVTIKDIGNSPDVNIYDRATHYSYDELGNVKLIVQENRHPQLKALAQQYKRVEYWYDLISGKMNRVRYQPNQADGYTQQYVYDDDNRLTNVYSSQSDLIWQQDASYTYFDHGPLARLELGQDKVQGLDYTYTIQGWLKAVNANAIDAKADMGRDGWPDIKTTPGNFPRRLHGRDAFGFSLSYFTGDYLSRTGNNAFLTDIAAVTPLTQLWNGNIAQMAVALSDPTGKRLPLMANTYTYDQLNRLMSNQPRLSVPTGAYNYTSATHTGNYDEFFRYDNNGNILNLDRNGPLSGPDNSMDRFRYRYYDKAGNVFDPQTANPLNATNRLAYVQDLDLNNNYDPDQAGPLLAPDLQNQAPGNFAYDATGNLIKDLSAEIDNIAWTVYGKIRTITRIAGSKLPDLEFEYDPSGQRIAKIVKPRPNGTPSSNTEWVYTWYARDATGNPLAIYDLQRTSQGMGLFLREQLLYGSSRLGTMRPDLLVARSNVSLPRTNGATLVKGQKQYELSNHLGNVLATVSDRKLPLATPGSSTVIPTNFSGWVRNGAGVLSNTGNSLQVSGSNNSDGATGQLPIVPGQSYTVTFDLSILSGSGSLSLVLVQKEAGSYRNYTHPFSVGTNSISFTAAAESYLNITLNTTGAQVFRLDNLVLKQTGIGAVLDYYAADVLGVGDYYAFGMEMVGRTVVGTGRFGFNGKEVDDEVNGSGNFQDYGMRAYDGRLGRFFSVDPLTVNYPMLTPYQFAGNKPIWAVDLDGLEETAYTRLLDKQMSTAAGAQRVIANNKEIAKAVYKPVAAALFKSAFSENLPKTFIDHYVNGDGKTMTLNSVEMAQVNTQPIGLTSGLVGKQVNAQISGMVPGESRKISFSASDAQAGSSGTLGQFTISGEGTFTMGESGDWSFSGTMQFSDTWDFNVETPEQEAVRAKETGVTRSANGKQQTEFAAKYLPGKGFDIKSEKVSITQTSKDKHFSWFKGKSSENIPNRDTKVKNEIE